MHSISEVPTNHLEKYGIQDAVRNIAYKEKTLLDSMRSFSPEVNFVIELNRKGGLGYYNDLCFNIFVKKDDDSPVLVAGGGSVD